MPKAWTRGDRRVRLRPDRAHAGPDGGRRRRRPVPPGRAGAAGGVRVLRVRARAPPAQLRPGPRARHRGPDLVRRRRRGRPRHADRQPRARGATIRETRLALDTKLGDAAATLGDSANKATVVTNSAIIVFREGLEGVLILAAITASMVGMRRRLRRPVFIGAFAGLVVSIFTWVLAITILQVARALRREARGGGRAHSHRRAAADHELVLPQGLLVGVDRQVPPPAQALREARADRLHLRAGDRPVRPRPHERVPRGVRDGAVPAVAAALAPAPRPWSRARASGSR